MNYSYDAQGAVSALSVNPVNPNGVGVGAGTTSLLSALGYNADNQVSGWLWSDGKARTLGYDSTGLVSSYSLGDPLGTGNAAGALRSLNRDAAGRITGYGHVNNGSPQSQLDQGFGYDNLNRLLSASLAGTSTLYSYDETGNRTSKTVGASSYPNTIAATSNRLAQTQDVGGTATITHDAAGHITSDGANSYTYTDRGRMSSAITGGGTVNYLYNGLNQRVKKSGPSPLVPTGAAYYLYDEAGQLLGEYDANGAPLYETIYLNTLPVGVMQQTGTAATNDIAVSLYNLHADHIATPRVITRQDQTIVWRWDTAEAFGGTAPNQNPSGLGAFTFNQRFPGQVFDAETGLFQNWNREYNARLGRYIQSDPIGLQGGINTFAYVGGSPLRYSDPKGLLLAQTLPVGALGLAFCQADPNCRQKLQQLAQQCVDAVDAIKNRIKDWMRNEGATTPVPPVPSDLVGDQSSDNAGLTKNGKRHTSGPLTPENGGTGDASKDFEHLTGGNSQPAGGTYPPGTSVGPNGVVLRPGQKGSGPRIDIPGNGNKPPETLHY